MCLMGAARITHRAQRVVALATKWHMIMTCASRSDTIQQVKLQHPPLPAAAATAIDDYQSADLGSPFQTRQALGEHLSSTHLSYLFDHGSMLHVPQTQTHLHLM